MCNRKRTSNTFAEWLIDNPYFTREPAGQWYLRKRQEKKAAMGTSVMGKEFIESQRQRILIPGMKELARKIEAYREKSLGKPSLFEEKRTSMLKRYLRN